MKENSEAVKLLIVLLELTQEVMKIEHYSKVGLLKEYSCGNINSRNSQWSYFIGKQLIFGAA